MPLKQYHASERELDRWDGDEEDEVMAGFVGGDHNPSTAHNNIAAKRRITWAGWRKA